MSHSNKLHVVMELLRQFQGVVMMQYLTVVAE